MSIYTEQELLIKRIKKNIYLIEILKKTNDKSNEIIISHLKHENSKLEKFLIKMRKEVLINE